MNSISKKGKSLSDKIKIWEFPNFMTNEECDLLLNDAEKVGYKQSEVDSKKNPTTLSRTSTTSFLELNKTEIGKKIIQRVKDILQGQPGIEVEGLQIQRYLPTQKYNPHYDTFEGKDSSDQRSWTFMIYLNDVEEGGGTFFSKINLRLIPKKGTGILWNNLDQKGCRDDNTLHMGEPVQKGVKYICTIWFRKDHESFCNQKDKFINKDLKGIYANTPSETNTSLSTGWIVFIIVVCILFLGGIIYFISFKKKKNKK